MVSIVPLETGRVSLKTPRVSVKSGICHWPDPVVESTKLLQDTKTKEYDEKLYKIIVSTVCGRAVAPKNSRHTRPVRHLERPHLEFKISFTLADLRLPDVVIILKS